MSVAGVSPKIISSPHQSAAAVDPLVEKAQKAAQISKSLPVFIKGMQKKVVHAGEDSLVKLATLAYAAMSDKGTDYLPALSAVLSQLPDTDTFDAAKAQLLKYIQTEGNQKKFGPNDALQRFLQSAQYENEPTLLEKAFELGQTSTSLPLAASRLQDQGVAKETAEQLAALAYAQMADPETDYKGAIEELLGEIPDDEVYYAAIDLLSKYVEKLAAKFDENEELAEFFHSRRLSKNPDSPKAELSEETDAPAPKSSSCSKWVWVIPAVIAAAGGLYLLNRWYREQSEPQPSLWDSASSLYTQAGSFVRKATTAAAETVNTAAQAGKEFPIPKPLRTFLKETIHIQFPEAPKVEEGFHDLFKIVQDAKGNLCYQLESQCAPIVDDAGNPVRPSGAGSFLYDPATSALRSIMAERRRQFALKNFAKFWETVRGS